jgi:hypothetical protein
MGSKTLFVLGLLFMSSAAYGKKDPHADLHTFIKNADQCDRMAGEWRSDLSKKRQKEIERLVIRYCGAAKKQLQVLAKKYKNDAKVQAVITQHAYDPVKYFYESERGR